MLPVLTMGHNTVLELVTHLAVKTEMACCADDQKPACCCESSDDEDANCQSGNCDSGQCLITTSTTLFTPDISTLSTDLEDVSDKKIPAVCSSYTPIDPGAIWIPPKIVS